MEGRALIDVYAAGRPWRLSMLPPDYSLQDAVPAADETALEDLLSFDRRSIGALRDLSTLFGDVQQLVSDLVRRNKELERLATIDPLTGLVNRRGFEGQLNREEERARRDQIAVSVVAIDVRNLKSVNDRYGHGTGDELLRAVGSALQSSARRSDLVARLGGDEFAALLPGASRAGAEIFLERVRTSIRSLLLPSGGIMHVELWSGLAVREEAQSLHEALQLADGRLLLDKQSREHRSPLS